MRRVPAPRRPPGRRARRALTELVPRTLHLLAGPAQAESLVHGSRFRSWIGPTADAEEVAAAVANRSAAGTDATHHCWAYRLWREDGVQEAGFDAGEPGGTAGRPILGVLRQRGLVHAVCVVSRWFGGVKLGTGGLARAYAGAAGAAVAAAREAGLVVPAEVRARRRLRFEYAGSGTVRRVVSRFRARERASRYAERAELDLTVPAAAAQAFEAALVDASGGAIEIVRLASCIEPL